MILVSMIELQESVKKIHLEGQTYQLGRKTNESK